MSQPRSRRELVADALNAVSPATELKLLSGLLAAERLAVAVYGEASHASVLTPDAQRLILRIRRQEQSHARLLGALIPGSPAGAQRPSAGQVETALGAYGITATLAGLSSERAWFTLLEQVEGALEGAYYKAIGRLGSPVHADLAARIMANEAQHSTLLLSFHNPTDIQLDVAVGLVKGRAGHQ